MTTAALRKLTMVALIVLLCAPAGGADPGTDQKKVKLRLLFADSLIQNVNRNDVLAAFKLWVETVGRNRGIQLEVQSDSYAGADELERRLGEKTVDLVIMTSLGYLQQTKSAGLAPVFAAVRNRDALFDDYVVVARRDRKMAALAAMRGKSVLFYRTGADLGRLWMEVTLGESGLGSVDEFFGTSNEATKPSSVVLPVFFGKADAAVVNRSGLETMKEMNPQLATQLEVVASSRPMPESVICLHEDFMEARADLLKGLAELHTEPRGEQILLVFKIDRLVPFKTEYLDGVRDLAARRARLLGPSGQNQVASTEKRGVLP